MSIKNFSQQVTGKDGVGDTGRKDYNTWSEITDETDLSNTLETEGRVTVEQLRQVLNDPRLDEYAPAEAIVVISLPGMGTGTVEAEIGSIEVAEHKVTGEKLMIVSAFVDVAKILGI